MEYTQRYKTRSGKNYVIKLSYNEKIRERDGSDRFVTSAMVIDEHKQPIAVPVTTDKFSTYEDFKTFGSYSAINYQGVREAAIDGLRTKILIRIEDELESLG